jgi:hypothetical protein
MRQTRIEVTWMKLLAIERTSLAKKDEQGTENEKKGQVKSRWALDVWLATYKAVRAFKYYCKLINA